MKSPFPGMDPYLEQHWRDVHHSLCTYSRDALQPQVRPALVARIEERLVVESAFADARSIYPDVKVVERVPLHDTSTHAGATAVAEPLVITETASEPATEGYITIVDPSTGGTLVTVIEFLSTSNKSTEGQARIDRSKRSSARPESASSRSTCCAATSG